MSKCKTKNRVCTSFTENLVLFKKNVGISQPREVPRRAERSRFYKDVKTVNPDTNTTLDSFFSSDGFGQPGSSNRKQETFNKNKTKLSSTIPNIQNLSKNKRDVENKQKYKDGFMYRLKQIYRQTLVLWIYFNVLKRFKLENTLITPNFFFYK